MNLSDIRSKVRSITDMDTTDLPDALLDMYAKDGFDRMIALERRWPFFQKSYSLSTVANQREYAISSIGTGDVLEITSVVDTTNGGQRLTLIAHEDAEAVWNGSSDLTGRPMHFSFWEGNIHIWPKPNAVYALALRGYRKPVDWTANTSTQIDTWWLRFTSCRRTLNSLRSIAILLMKPFVLWLLTLCVLRLIAR